MNLESKETYIHDIFRISIVLKALNGFVEIALGALLTFTGTASQLIVFFTRNELLEDPRDILANILAHFLPYLATHSQLFVAFYFLSHGIIKIFLVVSLWRDKLWAYPTSIVFLILFILYQIYRYTFTHSITLIFLTIFDLLVVWLVAHEYRYLEKRAQKNRTQN